MREETAPRGGELVHLTDILLALVLTDREQEARSGDLGLQQDRTEPLDVHFAQAELRVDEAQMNGLQIVEAAQTGDTLDGPAWKLGIGEQHHRKVPAGGMTGDIDALGIAPMSLNVSRNPAERSPTLADLLSHADGRDERIVDDDREVSRLDKTESDVGAVVLVVADPVAAMNVDLDRGEAGLLWPEYVETFAGRWPIRQIEIGRASCRERVLPTV